MAKIPLAGGFYEDGSLQFDSQNCINMYPEKGDDSSTKGQYKLTKIPGAITDTVVYETTLTPIINYQKFFKILGVHKASNGKVYLFFTSQLFTANLYFGFYEIEISSDNTVTRNLIIETSYVFDEQISICKMADNGTVISIITGSGISFFYNMETESFDQITDPDFPTEVIDVVFKDTYFIWLDNATDRFYISTSYATDPSDCVNAIEFGTTEANPDKLIALETTSNEVVIFGENSIEFFYNSANIDFPFEKLQGTVLSTGAVSRLSVSKIGNDIFFVGTDKYGFSSVFLLRNYQLTKVSTPPIERKIKQSTDITDTICYSYVDETHIFYCMNLPGLDSTLVYDMSTNMWHERQIIENGETFSLRGDYLFNLNNKNCLVSSKLYFKGPSAYSVHYIDVLDNDLGVYGVADPDVVPFYGTVDYIPLTVERTTQHLTNENKNILYKSIELDIQKGLISNDTYELLTGTLESSARESFDEQYIEILMSDDGGMTYKEPIILSLGGIGDYRKRIIARRLGVSRDTVFKIRASSSFRMDWSNIYIDYEVLDA